MLTGDEVPSKGYAVLSNVNLMKDPQQFLSQIGYCPQFDAIIEELTGREMVTLFGRLRGISNNFLHSEVEKWLHYLGI